MNFSAPTPPSPPPPPPDPALEQIRRQAEEDKTNALQQRVTTRTNDLLLRYGARAAFSGAGRSL